MDYDFDDVEIGTFQKLGRWIDDCRWLHPIRAWKQWRYRKACYVGKTELPPVDDDVWKRIGSFTETLSASNTYPGIQRGGVFIIPDAVFHDPSQWPMPTGTSPAPIEQGVDFD